MTGIQSITVVPSSKGVPRGEDHVNAKLTEAHIRRIRELHHEGYGYRVIARTFGISAGHTQRIVLRKAWVHVA